MPQPNQLIGSKYRLIRPLAQGGMGSLWVARHVQLEVDVAIKFRSSMEQLDPRAEHRFKREAQAAAQLKSPNVVHIHDYGIDAGTPYIAMELLEGEDFGQLLEREQRLSLSKALALTIQVGKALTRAHQVGIVHRDIKPSNLFLARHGDESVVKVLDFGIAKDQGSVADGITTSVGVVLGSPTYMSPEQARGGAVDHRSDVYSLSAVLYRMVTGVAPFVGSTSNDIMIKICTDPIPKPSALAADLPPAIDGFFAQALARRPGDRFQSVALLMKAFEEIVETHPESGRTPSGPNRAVVGRSTDTESIRSPLIQPEKRSLSRAWLFAALGVTLFFAFVLVWWPAEQRAAPQPSNTHQPLTVSDNVPPVEPSEVVEVQTNEKIIAPIHTPAGASEATAATEPASPASRRKPVRKVQRAPVAQEITDPVFGLPVPAEQTDKP